MDERANRALRNFFRRLRANNPKSSIATVVIQATYAKNISEGSKIASSFELLYGQKPRIMAEFDVTEGNAVSIKDHVQNVAQRRLDTLVNNNTKKLTAVAVGDYVYFWRDKDRWLGPARVVEGGHNIVRILSDEQTLTSSLNRI